MKYKVMRYSIMSCRIHEIQSHEIQSHEMQNYEMQNHEVQGRHMHDATYHGICIKTIIFTALNYFKHYFCILHMRAHSNSGTFVETKQMHVHNIKIHDA